MDQEKISGHYLNYEDDLLRMLFAGFRCSDSEAKEWLRCLSADPERKLIPLQFNVRAQKKAPDWKALSVLVDYIIENAVAIDGNSVDYFDEVSHHTKQLLDWYARFLGTDFHQLGIGHYIIALSNLRADLLNYDSSGNYGPLRNVHFPTRLDRPITVSNAIELFRYISSGAGLSFQFGEYLVRFQIGWHDSVYYREHPTLKRLRDFSFWKQLCYQGRFGLSDIFGFMGRLLAEHEEQPYNVDDPDSPYRYWMKYEQRNSRDLAPQVVYA